MGLGAHRGRCFSADDVISVEDGHAFHDLISKQTHHTLHLIPNGTHYYVAPFERESLMQALCDWTGRHLPNSFQHEDVSRDTISKAVATSKL